MIRLACLVRAHRRVDTLRVVLDELLGLQLSRPPFATWIVTMADRPTPDVLGVLEACKKVGFSFFQTDIPVLDAGRERFLEAQNEHLDYVERFYTPDWVYIVDDDFALDLDGAALLPEQLARTDVDAFYMKCLFVQNFHDFHNVKREHNSIRLYRHRPGARFSGKRMLSIPDELHDEYVIQGRTAQYPGVLFEYGGFTPEDRAATRAAYIEAGKDDAFVRSLLDFHLVPMPPGLKNPFLCLTAPLQSHSSSSEVTDSPPTTTASAPSSASS